MPTAPISMTGYAAVLDRVCDLLELGQVVLVGNSMGGAIAAETGVHFPARVQQLVLVSAAALSIADFNPAPSAALMSAITRTPRSLASAITYEASSPAPPVTPSV